MTKEIIGQKTRFPVMEAYTKLLDGEITLAEYGNMINLDIVSSPFYKDTFRKLYGLKKYTMKIIHARNGWSVSLKKFPDMFMTFGYFSTRRKARMAKSILKKSLQQVEDLTIP